MNFKPLILFFLVLILSKYVNAQQMPIDFSDVADNFSSFGGSSFSFGTDLTDSGNDVGRIYNNGTNSWQGITIDLLREIDLDFQKTISLSFYAFDSNAHNIVLKLEHGTNPDVQVMKTVSSSGWIKNIEFDFSNAVFSSDHNAVVATGIYNRLTIFIDGGVMVSGTYLIDDINDGSRFIDVNALDVIYNNLVWADEFDEDGTVNPENWHHQTQVIVPGVGWANGEVQHYTNRIDNSFVDGGFLNIVAKKENYTDQGLSKSYTSARLNSKFAFTYGRVDVRAKLPEGAGTWPAIWTLGKNINEDGAYWDDQGFDAVGWPACGEIDIMEHGLGALNEVSSALHTPCCHGGSPNKGTVMASDVASDFHIYSVNWSPDQITFLLDGIGFYTYNPSVKNASTWPFFEDQYILLNIAMGGVAGTIDPAFTESRMIIDYVRVFQNDPLNIDENSEQKFVMYPNPVLDVIHIDTVEDIDKIEIYNLVGNVVMSKERPDRIFDISNVSSGVYLLRIYSNQGVLTKKFIKY